MKVLFLTSAYPAPETPLVGIFVREHARAVAARADVAIVHLDRRSDAAGLPEVGRIEDDEFPAWRARYPHSPAPMSYLGNLAGAFAAYRSVRADGFDPDVIHAHFFLAGVPAVLLGRLFRKPVVITEQWSVFLPSDPATLSPTMARVARFAYEQADLVLPVSGALRDGIVATTHARARFQVVPNVVDVDLFAPDPAHAPPADGRARLVSVGGLYEPKGYEFLLEAVARLAAHRDDFHVSIVGDGPRGQEYRRLARDLGVDSVVSFLGYQPKEDVARIVQGSDLFVLTSRYDSNPCAVIEALAAGVPVVATAVGGIPEQVGDGMGLLARPLDVDSIAERLETALDSLGEFDRAAIADAARERYGPEAVAAAFVEAYGSAMRR